MTIDSFEPFAVNLLTRQTLLSREHIFYDYVKKDNKPALSNHVATANFVRNYVKNYVTKTQHVTKTNRVLKFYLQQLKDDHGNVLNMIPVLFAFKTPC